MRKGKLSVMMSAGEVLFAEIVFDNGERINIRKDEYEFVGLYKNRDCWVDGDEIYLDESKVRKLRRLRQRMGRGGGPNQQQETPQQRNEMRERDCIGKRSVINKSRLPKDTREALAISDNAFDNFALKLNKAARFDCRVKIEEYKGRLCKPHLSDDLRDIVRYEDEDGRNVEAAGNPKYLSIHRPLANHEKNAWLDLNPEPPRTADEDGKKIAKKKRGAIKRLFDQSKYTERKFRFCETDKDGFLYRPSAYFGDLDFGEIAEHHRHSIEALNLSVSGCEGTIDWRLIVGLGNESVYDTSMTLHHVYGIPYILASAVKGVVRSWIITERFGQDEKAAIKDKGFCDVFGCPKKIKDTLSYYNEERQGKVWFFDAFPLSRPEIEVDIMNPHYMPYYSNGEPPADYHDPKPIPFLTVKCGTVFQFLFGVKEKECADKMIESGQFHGRKPSDVVKEWLKKALEEHGIGAKTAVGYGYVKDCKIEGES